MNDNISKVIKKYSMRIKESYKIGEIGIGDFQMEGKKRDIGIIWNSRKDIRLLIIICYESYF